MNQLFPNSQDKSKLDKSTETLLLLMAGMGCSKELLGVLLELGPSVLSKEQQYFLQGPIIQHKSPRQETTPNRMYKAIPQERLTLLFEELKTGKDKWKVGPIELATVIYPATCDAPVKHELAQIYLWAGAKAHSIKYKKPEEEFWSMIGGHVVHDNQVCQPNGMYYYDYKNLCSEIRRKVVKTQKEREKKMRGNETPSLEVDNTDEIVQISLW